MNSPVNRSIDSFPLVGNNSPEKSLAQESPSSPESTPVQGRQQPIPPPNHPRQYRAIGLVYGQYQQTEGHLTQGLLKTDDGTEIEAVLLGRMISLIKNHLDLEQAHLWVVYPHIRQEDDHLHLQIVGVWEPETLSQTAVPTGVTELPAEEQKSGYFSIRGEVAFASLETEIIIVKIRQSSKTPDERPKFFKLKLKGVLPEKPVNRFWDLKVQLVGKTLLLQSGVDLGLAASKKPIKRSEKSQPNRGSGQGRRNRHQDSRSRPIDNSGEKRIGSPLPKPLPKTAKGGPTT